VPVNKLCKNELDRPIVAEVLRNKKGLSSLGQCTFSLVDLERGKREFRLMAKGEDIPIELRCEYFSILEKHTFLEYVQGGCEISLILAIDFTKSNGDPILQTSLHYTDPERPNEYVQAIKEVGEILQYYDSDGQIPVFGFGAKMPPRFDIVSHCFALNQNIFSPEVEGVQGALDVYFDALQKVHLHGPTHFAEIIEKSCEYASSVGLCQEKQQYFLLLIITDGIVNDLETTIDQLYLAANLPLSIVIIGVGKEDFSTMQLLDSDDRPLFSKRFNEVVSRDLVQFVPFREFKGQTYALAKEVLYEIPTQLIQFMQKANIKPNNRKAARPKLSNAGQTLASSSLNKPNVSYLSQDKPEFIEEVLQLGLPRRAIEDLLTLGIYCKSPQLVCELYESEKALTKRKPILKNNTVSIAKTVSIRDPKNKDLCFLCQANAIDLVLKDCGCEVICSKCVQMLGKNCPRCGNAVNRWTKRPSAAQHLRKQGSIS
jgi:hypothetical protein